MTLYWWTHWFWITPLKLYVAFLCWMSAVQCMSLPFVHTASVQNGHQNGPYVTKSLDISEKIIVETPKELPKYHTANFQEIAHYSTDEVTSLSSTSTEEQSTTVAVDVKDGLQESASEEYATLASSTDEPVPTVDSHILFPFKNSPLLPVETKTQTIEPFPLADINDKDDTNHGFLLSNLTETDNMTVEIPVIDEDSKIIWVGTKPSITEAKQKKETSLEEDAGSKESVEDQPMNDGPYSPSGSFINSTNIRGKSQPVAPVSTTADNILPEEKSGNHLTGKTVNRERTNNEKAALNVSVVSSTPSWWNESSDAEESNVTMVRSLSSVEGDAWRGVVPVSKERVGPASEPAGLHAASIAGIALGIVAAAASVGAVSYGLYRRRYLNKPQTLNDSNPDSSGYLDDSTLRENSEEMYSLDNDSFLNSLEAMTIQNYWTDSVKHTKL